MRIFKRKFKVYISGPMSGIVDHNFLAFNETAKRLKKCGFTPINPAKGGIIEGWSWSDYLRRDLAMLMEADAIIMLPGWSKSKGARLERHNAVELGIEVLTLRDLEEGMQWEG